MTGVLDDLFDSSMSLTQRKCKDRRWLLDS